MGVTGGERVKASEARRELGDTPFATTDAGQLTGRTENWGERARFIDVRWASTHGKFPLKLYATPPYRTSCATNFRFIAW